MSVTIVHEVGEYYVGVKGGKVYVARNGAVAAEVHGSFPDSPENRLRCARYADRQAKREGQSR